MPNLKFDELCEEGKLEVGVSHDLPADATPFDFSLSVVTKIVLV